MVEGTKCTGGLENNLLPSTRRQRRLLLIPGLVGEEERTGSSKFSVWTEILSSEQKDYTLHLAMYNPWRVWGSPEVFPERRCIVRCRAAYLDLHLKTKRPSQYVKREVRPKISTSQLYKKKLYWLLVLHCPQDKKSFMYGFEELRSSIRKQTMEHSFL